ncbi:MAG TPA: sigma-70 family RNA polymerase sigma factor [Phototrophicaceae bacterium]|nr:sigma-70 family RNA polymerase sigma factor [Phototrophicaceae bacterium]
MAGDTLTQAEFEQLAQTIRPELHRYATRMTGSVIDGEDVVQEALIKAYDSLPLLTHTTNVRGWLFRITHNKAIDHLRHTSDEPLELLDEVPMNDDPDLPLEEKELSALALSLFLKLAPRQRSCVILKDVLGYSLAEISELLNATVPEIKATLHRGRTHLRELAANIEVSTPKLDRRERELLARYVDHFNARDFDSLRLMLTDEARLELYNRVRLQGADQINGNYFNRYKQANNCRLALGLVDGHPALLAYDLEESASLPAYFMLLTWEGEQVALIRDYRYVRYVMRDAQITLI